MALLLSVAIFGSANAQFYEEGAYGSGEYSTGVSGGDSPSGGTDGGAGADSGNGDIGTGSGSNPESAPGPAPRPPDSDQANEPAPGAPSTELRDTPGSALSAPMAGGWSSLWIGFAVILGMALLVGAWISRKRRR